MRFACLRIVQPASLPRGITQPIWVPLVPLTLTLVGGIAVGLWGPAGKQDLSQGLLVLTFWQVVGFLIYVLPAGFAMWRAGEPLSSAGVSRQGFWQSGVSGLVLGAVWFAQSQLLGRSMRPDWPLAIPFLAAFAFAEEFLFRGYLQARFIARIGIWRGWVLASLIFAASHLPHFLIYNHLSATAALAATAQPARGGHRRRARDRPRRSLA